MMYETKLGEERDQEGRNQGMENCRSSNLLDYISQVQISPEKAIGLIEEST